MAHKTREAVDGGQGMYVRMERKGKSMVALGVVRDMALDHAAALLGRAPPSRRGLRRGHDRRRVRDGGGRGRLLRGRRRGGVYMRRGSRVRARGRSRSGARRGGVRGRGRRAGIRIVRTAARAGEGDGGAWGSESLEGIVPNIRPLDTVVQARKRDKI